MAVVGSEYSAAIDWPAVRLEVARGVVRVVVAGRLTAEVAAAARELILDACELKPKAVVLDLRVALDPTDRKALPHLVDVAERRCWAARCRLDITTSDPAVEETLATSGIY
jgi:anti-anti-sigma regulatory factor